MFEQTIYIFLLKKAERFRLSSVLIKASKNSLKHLKKFLTINDKYIQLNYINNNFIKFMLSLLLLIQFKAIRRNLQIKKKKKPLQLKFHMGGNNLTYTQKNISKFIWKFSAVNLTPTYKTCKVGNYFNLKSNTIALLLSNVVYRFSCPCDAGLAYIGKSTRHVVTRAKDT